ncbi:hypothetical protein ABPG72_022706 [Tetrahymena utriculariae]
MNNILIDQGNTFTMNLVQKCIDSLPKWDDVTRNMPFIITGSVGIAFILMSRSERKKQLQRERKILEQKLKKDTKPTEKKNDQGAKPADEEEEKKNDSTENSNNQKFLHLNHKYQTEKTEEKTPQSVNNNLRFQKKINKKTLENDSGSGDENDSDEFQKKLQQNQAHQGSNHAQINSSEYDFFNSYRHSQGEDDEEERFDKVNPNDQISEINSIHQKSTIPKEKRQKRAPIKINRNFATDTENNEKLQKLKSIVQKEKKIEDKVFFQMLLNIVGTEAEQDDDD